MDGSGICTACGAADVEVNTDENCPDCAGGSMESQPAAEESTPAEDGEEVAA